MKRKLQIFVSSTFLDLIPERQAAVSAILKAGHIPAGMELFTAGDKSQMDTIKKWIDESDVYMLILGGRYGSTESTTGISYTELEYDYAVETNKPLFAVVITDPALEKKVQVGGTAFLEKENTKELKQFRQKVLSNISSFFEDEKDIRLSVHESLSDFASSRELKGWVQADEIVDTKPLFEEIKKLSEENQQLKMTLAEQEKKFAARNPRQENFSEISELLRSIEIKVPAKINKGKETTADLFSIFVNNRDSFINGVTNSATTNDVASFFYFNVCPKLHVHGLVENEKVPGVRYRRYAITKAGTAFLADFDRWEFEIKQADEKRKAAEANSVTEKQAKVSTPKRAKSVRAKSSPEE